MDRQRVKKIREVFEAALQVHREMQHSYVAEVCADDASLRADVLELLRAHEDTGGLLNSAAVPRWPPLLAGGARTALPPDLVIAERFRIVRLIGQGGMGQVYEAIDQELKRTVALKLLPPERMEDPGARNRLGREARALAALRHPNICALHDLVRADDREILVMEYLEGETLADRLRRGGPLELPLLIRTAIQICAALDYAHRRGVLHRDLKPGNIMLTADGAKLLDFGIARFTQSDAHATATLTQDVGVLGTVHYMSPEQALGRPLDSRSDVFSVGVVLYEMAAGMVPFRGDTAAQVLHAVVNEEPPSVHDSNPAVPVALEDTIRRTLEKAPELRYSSAADLERDLRPLLDLDSVSGETPEASGRQNPNAVRWWVLAGVIGLLAGVFIYRAIDFRSAVNLECTRSQAEDIARRIAEGLRYPPVGLKPNVVFLHTPEFDEAARQGAAAVRGLVQTGHGFTWRVDFTPAGARRGPAWRDAGVSVRLSPSGRLIEFRSQPYVTLLPASRETVEQEAALLMRRWLGTDPPATPASVSEVPDLPGVLQVKWTGPSGLPGFREELGATLAADQVLQLYRHLRPPAGSGRAPHENDSTSTVQAVCGFLFVGAAYAYGLRTLLLFRRSGRLPWRLSLVLTSAAAAGAVWLGLSVAPFATGAPGAGAIHTLAAITGAVTLVALLPAAAGILIALKHRNYEAVTDLDRLLQMRLPYRKASSVLTQGLFAGVLLAGIYMSAVAVVVTDPRPLETGITGNTPWRFGETGLALWAGLFTLALVVALHWAERLVPRFPAAVLLAATGLALLSADFDRGVAQLSVDGIASAAVFACTLLVYRTGGLIAAMFSTATSLLIQAAAVGLHIGNDGFLRPSLAILGLPALLWCGALAGSAFARKRHR
jgi:tRNA A-37 threonylcarbamoyl transferase component Bud32